MTSALAKKRDELAKDCAKGNSSGAFAEGFDACFELMQERERIAVGGLKSIMETDFCDDAKEFANETLEKLGVKE